MENKPHIWQFARIGGVNRVSLNTGKDLLALEQLDKKLWTALSCPVHGLETDSKTLAYLDTDGDNRIRVPEVLAAVKWITSCINNPDKLTERPEVLPLSEINDSTEEGKILLASARQILKNLGKFDATSISVDDTSDTIRIFSGTRFNGDGIITTETPEDETIKNLIADILSCVTPLTDRSGEPGIDENLINGFYESCAAWTAWVEESKTNAPLVMPFGDNTATAYDVFCKLSNKIEDYFVRCRLAAFAPEATELLNNASARFEAIRERNLTAEMEEIASLPLANFNADKALILNTGINPAWRDALSLFTKLIVEPLFTATDTLNEAQWNTIVEKFQPYTAWLVSKTGSEVEHLGAERINHILAAGNKETLLGLIEEDKALQAEAENIFKVDKLTRFYRDIFVLLNNFVSFHDFYSSRKKANFQVGRLYIDQRSCDLCIKVNDMPKHGSMAGLSGICLIYCDCHSKVKNERMTIVAAFTDGDFDDIVVGRNALFFDNDGLDWDATIIKVIENPISIRQAFWSPYKKFGRFINKQIEKFASDREKAADAKAEADIAKKAQQADEGLSKAASSEPAPAAPAAPATPPPFDIGKFVGIFAAIGLAIGAIGSVLMAVFTGFLKLTWWQMPIALLGVMLAISGPSMILAWLKLRKRNLAPVLDANGWAINAKVTINIVFGRTLTQLATLPINSRLNLSDPFKKKKNPLWYIITGAVILAAAVLLTLHYFDIINLKFF